MLFPKAKSEKRKGGSTDSFFSVMILRGRGRVWTFTVSYGALIWVAVAVAFYGVFSGITIYSYFREMHSRGTRLELLRSLQDEVENTRKELYRARQRLKFLEDSLGHAKDRDIKDAGPEPEASAPPVVTVKNLTTKQAGQRLSVKFRLVKIKPDGTQTTGYIFMIASDLKSDPPRLWSHPRTTLKNGEPVDYKQGQAFKVRNYRIIRGRYFLEPETAPPSLLTILVYDESGRLRLRKEFPIE